MAVNRVDTLPAGYRFNPTDHEILGDYLPRKISNTQLPPNRIREVAFYNFDPDTLAEMCGSDAREEEPLFFFSKPSRHSGQVFGHGYWDLGTTWKMGRGPITLGFKARHVYYEATTGKRTKWHMDEYRTYLNDSEAHTRHWALMKMYHKCKIAKQNSGDDQNLHDPDIASRNDREGKGMQPEKKGNTKNEERHVKRIRGFQSTEDEKATCADSA